MIYFVSLYQQLRQTAPTTHHDPLTAPTAPHSLSPTLPRREGDETPEKRSNLKVHKAQTTTPCTRQSTCRGVPLCAPVPINVRSTLRAHTEVRPYNLNRERDNPLLTSPRSASPLARARTRRRKCNTISGCMSYGVRPFFYEKPSFLARISRI